MAVRFHHVVLRYNEITHTGDKRMELRDFIVHQIGRVHSDSEMVVDKHNQREWYEISIILSGNGKVSINGKTLDVKKGDVIFIAPNEEHGIVSDEFNLLRFDYVVFYPTNEKYRESLEKIVKENPNIEQRVITNESIGYFVNLAIAENFETSAFTKDNIDSLFQLLVSYFIESFERRLRKYDYRNIAEADVLCYFIMHYIKMNIFEIQNLNVLSKVTNYTYTYLSGLFKSVTNITLKQFYQECKLSAAKELVTEGKLKICEISDQLHYSSPYAFSRAFKNYFGVSPLDFRKEKSAMQRQIQRTSFVIDKT